MSASLAWNDAVPADTDVAIVGGGFSGLMTLVNILRSSPRTRVVVAEREPRWSPGIAYGACDPHHLLNVPAGRMGVVSDNPSSFHRWLDERTPGGYAPGDFVPRALFGEYLNEEIQKRLEPHRGRTRLVRSVITRLEPVSGGVRLHFEEGRSCLARAALIAPGIPVGRAPWAGIAHGVSPTALVADPWKAGAFDGVPPDAPVLIVGSGLTAIDVVLSLRTRNHRGHITLVSRNGRLPLPHALPGQPFMQFPEDAVQGGPGEVLALLRSAARQREAAGLDWQGAVDAVRPHTTAIWWRWSDHDRRRFLRWLRPFWEIHRHRAPVPVLAILDAMRASGQLEIVKGRLVGLQEAPEGNVMVGVSLYTGGARKISAARVFNCVGPATSLRETEDALVGDLLRSGIATTDDAGLGLRTNEDGRLIDARGGADAPVFVAGALRRGDLWESTAVPELRGQAERVAAALVSIVADHPSAGSISREENKQ